MDGEGSVSSSGESRIIVSIESEPNIDRFARLSLHALGGDEDADADDDMTPLSTDERSNSRAFNYQKLEESSAGEEDQDVEEGEEDEDTLRQEEGVIIADDGVQEVILSATVHSDLLSAQEDTRSECASDVRTLSPDLEESHSVVDCSEDIHGRDEEMSQQQDTNLNVKELTEALLEAERIQDASENAQMKDEAISKCAQDEAVEHDYLIESPVREQSVNLQEDANPLNDETNMTEIKPEVGVIRLVTLEILPEEKSTVTQINSFLDSERSGQEIKPPEQEKEELSPKSFVDHETKNEISVAKPSSPTEPIITTEESSNHHSVIDEDISDYNNFISIIQSNVVKEATKSKGIRFPIKHENKPGDFPKTMSELYTFDDEDITDNEKRNLQMRKRQDSIKTKIKTENTSLYQTTGHHRRYNMPALSIDMQTRIVLSNHNMEKEKKVFPRNRQIFIPGTFPRNIQNEGEYDLREEDPPEPVRVKRICYTQPIVQLTMIREEPQPKASASISLPASASVSLASQSVPATPEGLRPHTLIEPLRRSRSVSPFIVDRDDPMMLLLKDSMEIPLVHDGRL